jgi:hypothetical protein
MDPVRLIARVLCTIGILIVGSFTGLFVAMAIFILNGTLRTGEPMYVGSSTPQLMHVLLLAGAGLAVMSALAYARYKLGTTAANGRWLGPN